MENSVQKPKQNIFPLKNLVKTQTNDGDDDILLFSEIIVINTLTAYFFP